MIFTFMRIIYFVLSQNNSLLICSNRKFGFLVVFIQGLQVSVMNFGTSDTKGCQLYFYRPSQSNFIVLMEHHIEVMVLTVFKNFTWMSKNGVNLKSMGHRKLFALSLLVCFTNPSFRNVRNGGPGQTRTADLTIISRAL